MAVLTNFTAGHIQEYLDEKDGVKKSGPGTKKRAAKKTAPPTSAPVLTEGEQPDLVLPDNV